MGGGGERSENQSGLEGVAIKGGRCPQHLRCKKGESANHGKINKWRYFSRAGEIGSLIARFSICPVRACQSDASGAPLDPTGHPGSKPARPGGRAAGGW